ncbi:membrane protein [Vibrio sp. qd031]|uniref:outer membrane beta-barrel protein n=1 Tax=Vibrio sp. qd031 TaxID=1603038 RepID=UPI000A10D7FD|nr:outer membrane beta-barrel protein [Vibrio sp. qd031]ORT49698.1 membrane protein [Vibrio sp. qd031]
MKKTLLALALVGTSTFAMADAWLYGGANIGQAGFDSDSATTTGLHIGTGILPIIGVEAGYQNHGSAGFSDFDVDSSSSLYLAIKPSIDFGPLHIYGRLGAHTYDLAGTAGFTDEDGYDIMYGVGAEYFVFSMVSIGAGYQNFAMGDRNVDSFTLNATVHIF